MCSQLSVSNNFNHFSWSTKTIFESRFENIYLKIYPRLSSTQQKTQGHLYHLIEGMVLSSAFLFHLQLESAKSLGWSIEILFLDGTARH